MNIPTSRISSTLACVLAVVIPLAGIAGIQGSGLRNFAVVAPVTASDAGSVSVGGVAYTNPGATVEMDGHASSVAQIKVGDVVTAYGRGIGNRNDVIERLILNHLVRATVDSVDAASGTFSAGGQTVHINTDTTLNPALTLNDLAALLPGAKVQVSGWANSTGEIVASRVDVLAPAASTEVSGQLSSLDSARHRFKINQLTVDFSRSEVAGALNEGDDVVVTGAGFDGSGALLAQQVELVQPLQAAAGQTGRLDGIVTSVSSATRFEINGQPVVVTSATKRADPGAIATNSHVRVSGVFSSDGVLVAGLLQTRKK